MIIFAKVCYLLGPNKYLIEFLAWNESQLSSILMSQSKVVCPFIIPCTHFRELPRYKNANWFLPVASPWIRQYQCQTKVLWAAKTISRGNNCTSLYLKQSCFFGVWIWNVRMFLYLYFKCWKTRVGLLNSWNGY